jgi:Flp pilus assembly protein TadD
LKAFELETDVSAIPRELAGVCLELGHFDDAVRACERAVALEPDSAELISNLALAYLLSARLPEASRSIAASLKLDPTDKIGQHLSRRITEVVEGKCEQPKSLKEL